MISNHVIHILKVKYKMNYFVVQISMILREREREGVSLKMKKVLYKQRKQAQSVCVYVCVAYPCLKK